MTLNVLFAEEDTLFRLMQVALLRRQTPEGDKTLRYFFGDGFEQPLAELLAMADDLGLPRDIAVTVATTDAELEQALPHCDVLVTEKTPVTAAHLSVVAPRVRLIQQFGFDLRHIDVADAQARGIVLAKLQRITSLSCADHIVALVMALARSLLPAHRSVVARRDPAMPAAFAADPPRNKFNWSGVRDIRVLAEHTIGFIGMGENASLVATRLGSMGMRMLYTKRTRLPPDEEALLGVTYGTRDEVLAQSDFVSLHVPWEPATEKMVDAAFLARMKRGAYLINTARGGIVDERALFDALSSGHLAGAALDVYRYEPMVPDSPLLDIDTVLWTPHMSAGRPDFMLQDSRYVLENIARVLRGERPKWQVSPAD